jgi:hypothetical protein
MEFHRQLRPAFFFFFCFPLFQHPFCSIKLHMTTKAQKPIIIEAKGKKSSAFCVLPHERGWTSTVWTFLLAHVAVAVHNTYCYNLPAWLVCSVFLGVDDVIMAWIIKLLSYPKAISI